MNGEAALPLNMPAQLAAQHAAQHAAEADSSATSGLWVFGYGSLCWHPGFDFHRSVTGYIKGYARKFWQGNTTHRGTENQVRPEFAQLRASLPDVLPRRAPLPGSKPQGKASRGNPIS